jgi:hypothetical protein
MSTRATDQPRGPGWYEIRLQGHLDPHWAAWLDGMHIAPDTDGTTVLLGPVIDQSALHGLLARLRDIGLPLISVAQTERKQTPEPTRTQPDDPTGE